MTGDGGWKQMRREKQMRPGEVVNYVGLIYNKESGGERGRDDRMTELSRTLAREDLPKAKLWWLVLSLPRSLFGLQTSSKICGDRYRAMLDC